MFDKGHVAYIVISGILTIIALVLCNRFITKQGHKDKVLKVAAVVTVLLHYSVLYVDYFSSGMAEIESTMILPVYPCNVVMWLLLIVAFMKKRGTKLYYALAEMTFYIGLAGGIIGILFNEVYISTPNLRDWDVLNGLLSHSVMLFGCIYLLVGRFIDIRVKNVASLTWGLLLLLIDGVIVIGLYKVFDMDPPNCMYLLEKPFPNIPWFSTVTIGVMAIVIVFVVTVIYEQIVLKEEDRWYKRIKERMSHI